MLNLANYLPIDRFQALYSTGQAILPDSTLGTALFADISGFTQLTEKLITQFGQRRGAEELVAYLNIIYDALIATIHNYHGSVIGFSGDGLTCWFDGPIERTAWLAVSAAVQMQQSIRDLAQSPDQSLPLALKVAICAGPARRWAIGNPLIQLLDVLAGATLIRVGHAEKLAKPHQIVVDSAVVSCLAGRAVFFKTAIEDTESEFAQLLNLSELAPMDTWPTIDPNLSAGYEEQLREWILPAVYARLQAGLGAFLTELRPVVAFFLYFSGLDFDNDPLAEIKLNQFVGWVQTNAHEYGGSLMDITIGDKGSYIYIAFGAPHAYQNAAERAVRVANILSSPTPVLSQTVTDIRIGISQGVMRCGIYGGSQRQVYGALGDEVNVAARVMQAAQPGQILVTSAVKNEVKTTYNWESLPPLPIKGKSQPIQVYHLVSQALRSTSPVAPTYKLPMVGRAHKLNFVQQKLELTLTGQGQIVGISGEAGIGKSRLVAEIISLAAANDLEIYQGECQSYGTQIGYLIWQAIWSDLLQLEAEVTIEQQIEQLTRQIEKIDPAWLPRLPLLEPVLKLPIPTNELISSLDAKTRKVALENFLVELLKAKVADATHPLLFVLEDCHWLDALSQDLLEVLGQTLAQLPILIVLTYRPVEDDYTKPTTSAVMQLPYSSEVQLNSLSPAEVRQLIELKLGQELTHTSKLIERINNQAEGNPFYVEELINYLQAKGLDLLQTPQDDLDESELPNSLNSLVLSRIDQLNETEKGLLKVASVIGRLFRARWLWEVYPALGGAEKTLQTLQHLNRLDITLLDKTEPELEYLFRHIVIRDVAYESLAFSTRAALHQEIGLYIERTFASTLEQYYDLLAYHYSHSLNTDKQREYLSKAGSAAQANYSNATALDYYRRLLPLLQNQAEILDIKLKMGILMNILGQWSDLIEFYQDAITQTIQEKADLNQIAAMQKLLGTVYVLQSNYSEGQLWQEKARFSYQQVGNKAGGGQVLTELGRSYIFQNRFDEAQAILEESVALLRQTNSRSELAHALNSLGMVFISQENFKMANRFLQESLQIQRELNDREGIARVLNNLGVVLCAEHNYAVASEGFTEALNFFVQIGAKPRIAIVLDNLGLVAYRQGDYAKSQQYLYDSLRLCRELDYKMVALNACNILVGLEVATAAYARAARLAGAVHTNKDVIGGVALAEQAVYDEALADLRSKMAPELFEAEYRAGSTLSMDELLIFALQD